MQKISAIWICYSTIFFNICERNCSFLRQRWQVTTKRLSTTCFHIQLYCHFNSVGEIVNSYVKFFEYLNGMFVFTINPIILSAFSKFAKYYTDILLKF